MNGKCEQFNDTLKSMLKNLCAESVKKWNELVPCALFAYCEVPHGETGFTLFELLYGWPVRGQMAILRGLFTGEDEKHSSVIEHILTIRNLLAAMPEIVKEKIKNCFAIPGKTDAKKKSKSRRKEFIELVKQVDSIYS
ncbi:Hypothetical predicted protein [Mytilus galloprovincialis]|uniref:Integrase catalytic domain-containing protein n=1 Tax=Mytilus galloprovincialis TaxID=29158 RepID=A0A8B6H2V1_MYTGA|nr:Hypothetical predicted protein [Mytilus galloprovincialis]